MDERPHFTDRFADALAYATAVHSDQTRKGSGVPYIGHLLSVAGLVIEDGGHESQVIAALLHDAAEDQGGEETLREIEARFGEDVAEIVAACSDTFETPKPPWRQRKESYVAHLKEAPGEAVLVSLADKVDNSRAILRDLRAVGPELWERFNVTDPEQHLWYYRSLHEVFAQRSGSWMVGELGRVLDGITHLVAAQGGFGSKRLEDVLDALNRAETWSDAQRAEIEGEKVTMSPGDPDDDWEYDYNAAMMQLVDQAGRTIEALETEREALTAVREARSRG